MQRQQGRAQAVQTQAIRMAVWGEQQRFAEFTAALTGAAPGMEENGVPEALAGFGLRQA